MIMKHIQLFEDFIKNYGEDISHKEFENIEPGSKILYMGGQYEVVQNNRVTIVIKNPKTGDTKSINYSMFNHGGALTENKVAGKVYKDKEGTEYYVEKEAGHYVVVAKGKGGVPSEAWDDWFNRQEDAEEIAQKLAAGELDESLFLNEADDDDKQSTDRGPIDNEAVEKGLKTKSKESGVPIGILRAVMRRGMAAWKSGHRPGAGQEQWGYARVNSFLTKGKGTWGKADKDLAKEVRDGGHDAKL